MLWPSLQEDHIRQVIFALNYKQHGGSGLSFTYADVMDMDWRAAQAFVEMLSEQRNRESTALRAAGAKKGKK